MPNPPKKILLKLSGESLMGNTSFGIDQEACDKLAQAVNALREAKISVGIVLGGGNIFRGMQLESKGLERTSADQIGMLGTLINGIALQQALQAASCPTKVMSAIECTRVVESFHRTRALEYWTQGEVLIFVGGTGNPYFTTDTAAALRASEMEVDLLLKATKVDGVYDKDPLRFKDAKKFGHLSYTQALTDNLQVMDATALALCRANHIPIFVFNMALFTKEKIVEVLKKQTAGTIIQGE